MKNTIKMAMVAAGALAVSAGVTLAQYESDREQIVDLLESYETALNASDTDAVLTLYAPDGVFMPQHSPSQIGAVAVRRAYDNVFTAITLDVEFQVEEVHQMSPEWAFARTNSVGFVTINASGDRAPEANQELFIFNKSADGEWKIARYAFSTINPPRQ